MRLERILQARLIRARGIHQRAVVLNKEVNPIGTKLLIRQGMRDLKLRFQIVQRRPHFVELNFVVFADRPQQVNFDQIGERK